MNEIAVNPVACTIVWYSARKNVPDFNFIMATFIENVVCTSESRKQRELGASFAKVRGASHFLQPFLLRLLAGSREASALAPLALL